jgi:hypothetical protein
LQPQAAISDNGDFGMSESEDHLKSLPLAATIQRRRNGINNSVSRPSSPTIRSPIFVFFKLRTKKVARVQSYHRENP